jgi:hypothetical protein
MSASEFVAAANTFLAALPPFSTQVNADLAALLTLSQLVSTSTTSLTIGTGAQSLTVQTAKAYLAGQSVRIYSTATPDNYMDGTVTSYDSGTGALEVNVTSVGGSGTLAAWTVTLNGGLALTSATLAQFAATTSAQLAGVLSDALGSGPLAFASQAITATTRATTTTLGTTLNHTLSDTSATIGAFNGVAGVTYHVRFLGAGDITHSAGLNILQGAADITTAAGDTCRVFMLTATTCILFDYLRASGVVTKFVSSQQTITSAGALTLAHGLSSVPDLVMVKLVCQTAEWGYSIGDVVFAESTEQSSSLYDNQGVAITVDATNINVRYGAHATTFLLLDKTTGGGVSVTNANWKAVFIGVVI